MITAHMHTHEYPVHVYASLIYIVRDSYSYIVRDTCTQFVIQKRQLVHTQVSRACVRIYTCTFYTYIVCIDVFIARESRTVTLYLHIHFLSIYAPTHMHTHALKTHTPLWLYTPTHTHTHVLQNMHTHTLTLTHTHTHTQQCARTLTVCCPWAM